LSKDFTLITGRTREQGIGLHQGKESEEYRRATTRVDMNDEDMARLKVEEGQIVRVRTAAGQIEIPAHRGSLPPGMLFIPMGPAGNLLIGTDSESTGMPWFKGLMAEVEPT
jgi:formylmethanofuran dehydrogenase subunit D